MSRPTVIRRFLVLAAACLLWRAVAAAEPQPLVQPGDRVVIFGDSISTGKGYGFIAVDLLNHEQPDLKLTGIDHGHPGWTATHAVTVLDDVLAKQPNVVTIMFGTNDLGGGGARGVAELKERLRALVVPLQKAGVRVVLLTTPYTSNATATGREQNRASLPRMGEDIVALGQELQVPVFDMFASMRQADAEGQAKDPQFQMFSAPGDVHPNARGHQLMGRALADFLLGKSAVKHTPFKWTYPGQPVAAAPFAATAPASAADVPGVQPMVLERREQVSEPERWQGPADLSAKAYAAWSQTALYLTVEVVDDVVLPGDQQPAWGDDGIEFFFDTRPTAARDVALTPGYYQLLVAVPKADGPAFTAVGNFSPLETQANIIAVGTRTPTGYRVQVTIPWVQFHFTPAPGATIGFDFAINDKDKPDQPRYKVLWRGAGDDYLNAGATGVLRLEEK